MNPNKLSRADLVDFADNVATGVADGKVPGFLAAQNTSFSDALTDANTELGEGLKARDKELDRLHKQMIASLSSRLEAAGARAEGLLHLIFVARSIERIGDLAVNIGEDAVYLDSARDIRHDKSRIVPKETQAE